LENDFIRADALVNRFHRLTATGKLKSDDLAKDVWGLVESATALRDRLAAALPHDVSDVERAAKTGTAKYSTPNRIRTPDWLEENGRCLDNIRPGDSTIPQAGKGAFATRSIKEGDVIAPMPVVQILRRDLEIYEDNSLEGSSKPDIRYLTDQLLKNYCYGGKDSSLLLFPYSPVVNYMNHNATTFNAKIRWSSLSRKDWLERTPDELARESHAGLIMEVVAVRDIRPDEEVLLNYGDDWDKAWRERVIDWYPTDDEELKSYTPASKFNDRVEWLRTERELEAEPYPDNVMTVCFVGGEPPPNGAKTYRWTHYDGIFQDAGYAHPCQIVDREGNVDLDDAYDRKDSIFPADLRYTARVYREEEEEEVTYTNIPRQAVRFFDVPYSSDNSLRTAFRHEIRLPDDMVPPKWRDLAGKKK